ncbi:MAG: hypothetical protein R6V59_03960 [Dehalococcoidia bacterium]
MKTTVKEMLKSQTGKVLVLVLVLLVVGGLVLAPLLGLMSTGLASGQVYEKKAAELYAADAGVEDAIWKLMNPDVSGLGHGECADTAWSHNYTISEVNGKGVQVTIDYLGEGVFRITSTASADGSSTTILSYVEATEETVEDETIEGSLDYEYHTDGNLHVTGSIEGEAKVYVGGNLTVDRNIEGDDVEVYVQGDLIMSGFGNIEDTAIVCVGGDLYIGHCSEDGVQVYVEGNLIGVGSGNGIENEAKVCVEGDTTVDKIEGGTVCVGGELTVNDDQGGYIYNNAYADPFVECPMCCWNQEGGCYSEGICCECPLIWTGSGEGGWTDWAVTIYLINPESD